jgi:hypothetical protein
MSRFLNPAGFTAFRTAVTSSGTPVQMASNAVPDGVSIIVRALRTNTGIITVGNSSANALNTGTDNFQLQQGQSVSLQLDDTDLIWIDATVDGEAVETILEL